MPKRNSKAERLVVPSDALHKHDYVSDSDNSNGDLATEKKVYRRREKREDGNKAKVEVDTCESESLITYIKKQKINNGEKNSPKSNGYTNKKTNKVKGVKRAKSKGESSQVAKKAKNNDHSMEENNNNNKKSSQGKSAKNNSDEQKSNGQKKIKRDSKANSDGSNQSEEKKRSKSKKKRDEDGEEEDEKSESALYQFPHNRIHRIIKSEHVDGKMSQEAIFVINKATEKFLEVFCREAYACTFLDRNNYVGYDHLSSVVSKRHRFDFLADFVPKKVRAEDALAEISKGEET